MLSWLSFPMMSRELRPMAKNNYIVKICAAAGMTNLPHARISATMGLC
jgi:hypothetical protein